MRNVLSHLLFVTAIAAVAACGGKKKAPTTPDVNASKGSGGGGTISAKNDQPSSGVTVDKGDGGPASFSPVYFEFDSYTLSADGRSELQRLADWMLANKTATVTIEGHADERGTDEYNIALGERRAQAIQEYLGRLGVPGNRMRTISYGEERPAVAGSNEDAWSQNRRGELKTN